MLYKNEVTVNVFVVASVQSRGIRKCQKSIKSEAVENGDVQTKFEQGFRY